MSISQILSWMSSLVSGLRSYDRRSTNGYILNCSASFGLLKQSMEMFAVLYLFFGQGI